MYRLIEKDHENLWSAIWTLSSQELFDQSKTLIKLAIENTLTGTPFSNLIEEIHSINPSPNPFKKEDAEKFMEIEKQLMNTSSFENENTKLDAKLAIIDYLELISKILDDSQEELRKKLLANLITLEEKPSNKAAGISPKEASIILGVSDQTIRRMCEKGKFPGAYKTDGGHWKIPSSHFKITKAQASQIELDIKDIRKKAIEGGEVDEFDVIQR
ncbi:helix-turn-helix domain-containing protein [Metabacillus sp. GX 13764]|uniref:helix-turn-helix domain-containing protein n=1 Tax=Metabacillus kandeliae TaxID=2900151 RepID=UPI001E59D499|nr:helix-turn-helix domain-containing protein [Metabacillus kandeliae]MCD7034599.1 helix-turn-helix domain-containing protein [Metabacillus kandeliae]